jgi:hypothetical protein
MTFNYNIIARQVSRTLSKNITMNMLSRRLTPMARVMVRVRVMGRVRKRGRVMKKKKKKKHPGKGRFRKSPLLLSAGPPPHSQFSRQLQRVMGMVKGRRGMKPTRLTLVSWGSTRKKNPNKHVTTPPTLLIPCLPILTPSPSAKHPKKPSSAKVPLRRPPRPSLRRSASDLSRERASKA